MVVYKILNKINKKAYVGITKMPLHVRMNMHFNLKKKGCPLLGKAIEKYGKTNFTYKILEKVDSLKKLEKREKFWIKKLKTLAPKGYNMLPGGYTNQMAIERLKTAVVRLDTQEIYQSLVEASEKTNTPRHSITFSCIGRQDRANKIPFRYVDKLLFEKAEKRRQKRKSKKKAVLHLPTGRIFASISEASRATKRSTSHIWRRCNGIASSKKRDFVFVNKKGEPYVK